MPPKVKEPQKQIKILFRAFFSSFFIIEFFFSSSKAPVGFYNREKIIISFINSAVRKGAFSIILPLECYFRPCLHIYKAHLSLSVYTEKTVRQIKKKIQKSMSTNIFLKSGFQQIVL